MRSQTNVVGIFFLHYSLISGAIWNSCLLSWWTFWSDRVQKRIRYAIIQLTIKNCRKMHRNCFYFWWISQYFFLCRSPPSIHFHFVRFHALYISLWIQAVQKLRCCVHISSSRATAFIVACMSLSPNDLPFLVDDRSPNRFSNNIFIFFFLLFSLCMSMNMKDKNTPQTLRQWKRNIASFYVVVVVVMLWNSTGNCWKTNDHYNLTLY